MSEKVTRIADGTTGDYIATRDAIEFGEAHARVIQRVDVSEGKFQHNLNALIRNITTVDTDNDLGANCCADPMQNVLLVGDKSDIVISVEGYVASGDFTVGIVPIFVSKYREALYVLPEMTFNSTDSDMVRTVVTTQSTCGSTSGIGDGNCSAASGYGFLAGDTCLICPAQVISATGAHGVALFVKTLTGTTPVIRVYAFAK